MQRTLAILKPDSVAARNTGPILEHLEEKGFEVLALRKLKLGREQARSFYAVHRERPFYDSLVAFMTEGPLVAVALERDDAVRELRAVMGATDPKDVAAGTIRDRFGSSIERNAIHGSDSPENAAIELAFFFPAIELIAAPS